MTLAAACLAATNVGAQELKTYNDTVRRNTWTLTVGGGVNGTTKQRDVESSMHHRLAPEAFVGVKYNITPMWRLALNAGFIYKRNYDEKIITTTKETPDYKIPYSYTKDGQTVNGDFTATLITNAARIDNTWHGNLYYAELAINWNILDLWHYRKAQKWNLWLGAGAGYLYTDWSNGEMWAYDENALGQTDTYFNAYNHSYVRSYSTGHYLNSLYIPVSLSLEYDITPRWTVGAYGKYMFFPLKQDYGFKGMWGAGLSISYNFLGSKMPTNKQKLDEALAKYDQLQRDCDERNGQLDQALQDADKRNKQLLDEADNLRKQLSDKDAQLNKVPEHVVYFNVNKTNLTTQEKTRLDDYISRLKKSPAAKLHLIGEASAEGYKKSNQSLSEGRLETVLSYLKSQGINDASIVQTEAIGDTKSIFHPRYRRVTIKVAE